MAKTESHKDGKTEKRPRVKRVKRTIVLSHEASHLLDVHVTGTKLNASAVIEGWILEHGQVFELVLKPRAGNGRAEGTAA